jgi:hypothetical protein
LQRSGILWNWGFEPILQMNIQKTPAYGLGFGAFG